MEPGRTEGAVRWSVVAGALAVVAIWVVSALLLLGVGERGAAYATRTTARLAFLLFLASFVAPAMGAWVARRRSLFVAFAACHLVHFGTIVWLAFITDGASVGPRLDPTHFAGAVTYLTIVTIAAGYATGRIPERGVSGWRRFESIGTWYIWASFVLAYVGKASTSPPFAVLPALLLVAAGLRWRHARVPR